MAGKEIPPTRRGHAPQELVSWLQKAIRRGLEDDALWVVAEMEQSGYGAWTWARLRTVCSEDVGLAEPGIAAEINALHQTWRDFERNRKGSGKLPLVHATLLLCRARKSRLVDWALIAAFEENEDRQVPDLALDKHTLRGRQAGKGWPEFFDEGTLLEPHVEQPREADFKQRAWDALHAAKSAPNVGTAEPTQNTHTTNKGQVPSEQLPLSDIEP